VKRVYEHKNADVNSYTKRYNCKNLVYFEILDDMYEAIKREKRLKNYLREWKIELIEKNNPEWLDLYNEIL
jgi:putative endonuclease